MAHVAHGRGVISLQNICLSALVAAKSLLGKAKN